VCASSSSSSHFKRAIKSIKDAFSIFSSPPAAAFYIQKISLSLSRILKKEQNFIIFLPETVACVGIKIIEMVQHMACG
jgi:hypothetical protein